jgi:hypothetical protein
MKFYLNFNSVSFKKILTNEKEEIILIEFEYENVRKREYYNYFEIICK